MSSGCHSVKIRSTTVDYYLDAMVTDLCCPLTIRGEHGIQCKMLPEIHTMEKGDLLKSTIHS